MRIILEQLQQMIEEGKKFEEIDGAIDAYMQKTRLFCSLKSLHNLAQNGRVSKVVASAAEVLGISVIEQQAVMEHWKQSVNAEVIKSFL